MTKPPTLQSIARLGGALALVLSMMDAQAQTPNFIDSGQRLGDQITADIALGDVDGDGDLDAVAAHTGFPVPGESRLWINQGGAQNGVAGQFIDSLQDFGARNSESVALGDLDGDGDLDLVFGHELEGDRVWLNQNGVFTDSGQTLGSGQSRGLALGDFDSDGDLDLAVATFGLGEPDRIWINQGGAQDGTPALFLPGPALAVVNSNDVVVLDAEGDGDLDVMVAVFNTQGSRGNRLFINQGGLQGGVPGSFFDSGQVIGDRDTLSLAVGDLDADGDPDVFAGNGTLAAPDQVWFNQGGVQGGTVGQFQPGPDLFGDDSLDVALGDLDGDGDLDAFVAKFQDPGLGNEVWLNDSSGGFSDSGLRLGDSRSRSVALGDLDGDGDLDAFVGNGTSITDRADRVWLNQPPPPGPEADMVLQASPVGVDVLRLADSFDPLTAQMSIELTNLGPDPATGVRVRALGEGTTMTGGDFTCSDIGLGLFCDRPTLLPGATATAMFSRSISRQFPLSIYAGNVSISVLASALETDPEPSGLDASYSAEYYDCATTGCLLEQLFCLFNFSTRAGSSIGPGETVNLPIYYLLRQRMNFSILGQRLVDRYAEHQAEIMALAEFDSGLMGQILSVLSDWQSGLAALVSGQGDSVTITASMIAGLDALLIEISQAGSPDLAAAISEERALLGPLTDFAGLSFQQAADQLIGSELISIQSFERPELLTR